MPSGVDGTRLFAADRSDGLRVRALEQVNVGTVLGEGDGDAWLGCDSAAADF
jgi:hypothetical protein